MSEPTIEEVEARLRHEEDYTSIADRDLRQIPTKMLARIVAGKTYCDCVIERVDRIAICKEYIRRKR